MKWTHSPRAVVAETDRSLGFTGQPTFLNQQAPGQWEPVSKPPKNTWGWPLAQAHACTYTLTHRYTVLVSVAVIKYRPKPAWRKRNCLPYKVHHLWGKPRQKPGEDRKKIQQKKEAAQLPLLYSPGPGKTPASLGRALLCQLTINKICHRHSHWRK